MSLGALVGGFGGGAIGGATVTLLLNDSEFNSALTRDEAKFRASTSSMGAGASKAGAIAKAGFNTMALGAGIAVAAGVNMATTFEKTFAQIGSLAGKLGVPMDQAKAHVLSLAKATGQDPNGLAQALYFAASAGLQASQVMPVLDASAKAAAIGMGDAQTVAQTLTSVLNAYKGTGLDTAGVMNIMTAAVKDGKAEMSDFATGLGPVISVAAAAGVSFNDMAAAIAEATNQGVPFSRAVTGLRFLISSLEAPTAKASSALSSIGLSASDVAKMLQQPGGLEKAIQLIHDRTAQMGDAGRTAWSAITGGARGSIVAIDLVGKHTADTNRIVADLGRSAQKGATDFSDAWSKISKTDAVKFQKALADVKVALIQLGEKVLPTLGPFVTDLGNVLQAVIPLAPAVLGLWAAFKGYTILKAVNTSLEVFAAKSVLAGAGMTGIAGSTALAIAQLIPFIKLATVAYALGSIPTAPNTDPSKVTDFAKHQVTATEMITAAIDQQKFSYSDLAKFVGATDSATQKSIPTYKALYDTFGAVYTQTGQTVAALQVVPGILEDAALASKKADQAQKGLLQGLYQTPAAAKGAATATDTLTAAQKRQEAAAKTAVAALSGFFGTSVTDLASAKKAYRAWGQQVGTTFNDVETNLGQLAGDNKATFADMQKAVRTGMQSMKSFGQDIHTITKGGSADAKNFAAYLVSLGPAGEKMAADLAAQPPKVRASFERNFAAAGVAGQSLGRQLENSIVGALTRVEAEVLVASGKFATLQAAIDALHGKNIVIGVTYNVQNAPGPVAGGKVLP